MTQRHKKWSLNATGKTFLGAQSARRRSPLPTPRIGKSSASKVFCKQGMSRYWNCQSRRVATQGPAQRGRRNCCSPSTLMGMPQFWCLKALMQSSYYFPPLFSTLRIGKSVDLLHPDRNPLRGHLSIPTVTRPAVRWNRTSPSIYPCTCG